MVRTMPIEEARTIFASTGHTMVDEGEYVNATTWVDCVHTCGEVNSLMATQIKSGIVRIGCPSCREAQRSKWAIIPEAQAVAEMKARGYTPIVPYPGTGHPWLCIHDECGREVSPTRSNLLASQGGCRICADKNSGKRRRLPWAQVEKAFTDNGFTLMTSDYESSHKPMSCICNDCGKRNDISYSDVAGGHGCRYCNNRFFKDKPTMVYLMNNSALKALKIGITLRKPAKMKRGKHPRLREHERSGFRVVRTWNFDTGEPAWNIEQEVLRHWREELNAPQFVTAEQMCHHGRTCCSGATETVSSRKVGLQRTIDHIDSLVYSQEQLAA